jgi:hypothetical protein
MYWYTSWPTSPNLITAPSSRDSSTGRSRIGGNAKRNFGLRRQRSSGAGPTWDSRRAACPWPPAHLAMPGTRTSRGGDEGGAATNESMIFWRRRSRSRPSKTDQSVKMCPSHKGTSIAVFRQ